MGRNESVGNYIYTAGGNRRRALQCGVGGDGTVEIDVCVAGANSRGAPQCVANIHGPLRHCDIWRQWRVDCYRWQHHLCGDGH